MISTTAVIAEIKNKNVLIIGCPASGKTYLASKLAGDSHTVIHTDDFIDKGYKDSLYAILDHIKTINGNSIVEGVQGYRLLRKGVEFNCYYPDIVIELEISEKRLSQTYNEVRRGKSFESLASFNAGHQKILKEYFAMDNKNKPKWFKIQNDY